MQAWYLYDGSGQRVEQYVSGGSGNHTYYLPGNVEEVTPSGSLIKYYNAGGMLIGVNTAHDASGISYLASDGLGSVSEALSQSGTATGAVLYSPYGGVRYSSGTMPTAKGFTGQYADTQSSGLDYYGARYYDASLGQFTSADTVTDGINRYGYVMGNPETATDPTGHRRACDHDCGTPAPPPQTKPDCHTTHTCSTDDGGGSGGKHKPPTCDKTCQDNHSKGIWDVITGVGGLALLAVGIAGACFGPIPVACGVAWKALAPLIMQSIHAILDGVDLLHQSDGGQVGDTTSLIIRGARVVVDVLQAILSISDIVAAVKNFSRVASEVTGIGQAISDAEDAESYAYKISHASSPEQARGFKAAQTRARNRAVNGFVEGIGGITAGVLGLQNVGNDVIDFQTTLDAWSAANGA